MGRGGLVPEGGLPCRPRCPAAPPPPPTPPSRCRRGGRLSRLRRTSGGGGWWWMVMRVVGPGAGGARVFANALPGQSPGADPGGGTTAAAAPPAARRPAGARAAGRRPSWPVALRLHRPLGLPGRGGGTSPRRHGGHRPSPARRARRVPPPWPSRVPSGAHAPRRGGVGWWGGGVALGEEEGVAGGVRRGRRRRLGWRGGVRGGLPTARWGGWGGVGVGGPRPDSPLLPRHARCFPPSRGRRAGGGVVLPVDASSLWRGRCPGRHP